jgi:hypothetical protein
MVISQYLSSHSHRLNYDYSLGMFVMLVKKIHIISGMGKEHRIPSSDLVCDQTWPANYEISGQTDFYATSGRSSHRVV